LGFWQHHTARKPKVVFSTFFLGSVKTGVEPNILVRDLYAPTVSSFREIIHFLPTKKTENDNAIVV
jgi:hypothetical protein